MENRTYYYARVSSTSQNLDRQIDEFKKIGAQERDIITDKESGKDTNRPGYLALRNTILRSGDTLVIKSLDRLSRNKNDIRNELQYYKDNHIRIKVLDLPTTLIDWPEGQEWIFEMINNILIEVIGTIAEQERLTIKTRQKEGIESARRRNVKFGRPQAVRAPNWDSVISEWREGRITARKAMELTNTKRSTFYNLLKNK